MSDFYFLSFVVERNEGRRVGTTEGHFLKYRKFRALEFPGPINFVYYYLFITCNSVDTRWQQSLHVTLARTMKILL